MTDKLVTRLQDALERYDTTSEEAEVLLNDVAALEHKLETIVAGRLKIFGKLKDTEQRVERLERAIHEALADEETGKWGPDVTVALDLAKALTEEEA